MDEKLWFLVLNGDVIGVYDDYEIAVEEKEYLEEENYRDEVILKRKNLNKIEEFSVEYELAKERGYI